jgi:hypothetical protein
MKKKCEPAVPHLPLQNEENMPAGSSSLADAE